MPVRRALFQTPQRPTKRRRMTKKKAPMRIPKSMLPEMKQYTTTGLSASTNYAYLSLYGSMTQGDGSDQFVGSKFTLKRFRFMYDYSDLSATLTEGVRISVVIPKDPSITPTITDHIDPWDTQNYTVLYDSVLPKDPSCLAGTFDVTGPIHMQGSSGGTSPLRNAVHLYVHSAGLGSTLASPSRCSSSVWFTDA